MNIYSELLEKILYYHNNDLSSEFDKMLHPYSDKGPVLLINNGPTVSTFIFKKLKLYHPEKHCLSCSSPNNKHVVVPIFSICDLCSTNTLNGSINPSLIFRYDEITSARSSIKYTHYFIDNKGCHLYGIGYNGTYAKMSITISNKFNEISIPFDLYKEYKLYNKTNFTPFLCTKKSLAIFRKCVHF